MLYVPFPNAPANGAKVVSDSFTFVLVRNSAQSNIAKVAIDVYVGDFKDFTTPGSVPTPAVPKLFGGSYKTPMLLVTALCVILGVAIAILGFFLYKKKYGSGDMIGTQAV